MNPGPDDLRTEIVRVLLFVLVLFTGAEIAATFTGAKFSDPLFIATFVTGALGTVIGYSRARADQQARTIIIMKNETFKELTENYHDLTIDMKRLIIVDKMEDAMKALEVETSKSWPRIYTK